MVFVKTAIPKEEMIWVKCSVIGKLKDKLECKKIQVELSKEGVHVQVRILDD